MERTLRNVLSGQTDLFRGMRGFPGRVFYGLFDSSFFPLLSLSVAVKNAAQAFPTGALSKIHSLETDIDQWVKPSGLFGANKNIETTKKCVKLIEVVFKHQWTVLRYWLIFKIRLGIAVFSLPYCFSWRDVEEKWLKDQLVSLESLLLVCSSRSHNFKRCFADLAHSFSHFNHQM